MSWSGQNLSRPPNVDSTFQAGDATIKPMADSARGALHLIAAKRSASRDFLRLALLVCNTPVLAALSKAAVTARKAAEASSFFPAVTSVRNFRSEERRVGKDCSSRYLR